MKVKMSNNFLCVLLSYMEGGWNTAPLIRELITAKR